jgi:collagen type VII alpha
MRSSLSFGVCVAMVLGAAACGSSLPTQNKEMTSAVVGPSGGMLASSDGALQVAIPAGALPSNVTVTIVPTTPPGSGAIGTTYEIGPTGTQFAMPVTLTFDYGATSLGGVDPSLLRVATFAAGSWQLLSGASFDTQAQTVSGTTTHLSPYGLTAAAAGAMCAMVAGGVSCSGGTDTGSSSGTAGTTGAADMTGGVASGGTTGAGGATVSCTPSTCADATDACAAYPGAAMTGCTDGPNGYMATCCFPAGGSICLQAAGGGSGCAVDCAAGGSCTTTCPPPPTCADATAASACGGLAGATLQSCVDGPSGYTAACCFAPGAPVCATVGAGRACGGSTNGTTTCAPAPTCADGDPCAGLAGATVQSCTDSADGYTAVCCLPVGEVPSRGGGTSSGGGAGGASSGGSGTAGVDGSSSGAGGGSGTTGGGGAPTGTGGTTSTGGTTGGGGVPG